MVSEQTNKLIHENWIDLVKTLTDNKARSLAKELSAKGILKVQEVENIFSTNDELHNKRMLLFAIQEKDNFVPHLVDWLVSNGYSSLAKKFTVKNPGAQHPDENESVFSEALLTDVTSDNTTHVLNIEVSLASTFLDCAGRVPNLPYYWTRSKHRGQALIINNYEFLCPYLHEDRTGAKVDEDNLEKLFLQMGGWKIEKHSNQTVTEMTHILKKFAKNKKKKQSDICFVFIMSHGHEEFNKTIIYGTDGNYLTTTEVQNYFTNENCILFRNKPKIFIYQVCRGGKLDFPVQVHGEAIGINNYIDTDGFFCFKPSTTPPIKPKTPEHLEFSQLRPIEDMLVGYATLHGSKAHREAKTGSWYIQLICQHFMTLANHESVDDLLMKVDEDLRKRKSTSNSVQTSVTHNMWFKKCYLNPGIYQKNGILKKY